MKTLLVSTLGLLAVVYCSLCAWMYLAQRSMMYFRVPERNEPVADVLRLPVDGAVLKVWYLVRGSGKALIYFGGNAEDVGASIGEFAQALPEYSLYFVNYRGYAGSTGSPSERALFADAVALFDRVRTSHTDVSVLGRSLGSGIAVYLAAARPVAKLVLVTPFDSATRLGQTHFRWLPVSWLLKDRYDSISRAPLLACPILVLIAEADEIIGRRHSDALVAAFAPGRAAALVVRGAGHNDIQLWPYYLKRIAEFIEGSGSESARGLPERR